MPGWSPDRPKLPGNWQSIRRLVFRRDRGTCQLRFEGVCTGRATEVDHIESNADHRLFNLRAVCAPCHSLRTQQQAAEGMRAAWARTRPRESKHPGLL